MKHVPSLLLTMFLSSCSALPQLFQATEDIADDTAIKIQVSREALTEKTNLQLNLDVKNKEFEAK
jgi:hypothetical protein